MAIRHSHGSRGSPGRRPKAMTRTALPGLPFAPDSRMTVGNLPQIILLIITYYTETIKEPYYLILQASDPP